MCIFSQQQMIVSNPNDPYEWWRLVSDTPVSLSILYIFISVSCLRRDIRKDPWNKYFIEWSLMKQIKSIICDNIIVKVCKSSFSFHLSFKWHTQNKSHYKSPLDIIKKPSSQEVKKSSINKIWYKNFLLKLPIIS